MVPGSGVSKDPCSVCRRPAAHPRCCAARSAACRPPRNKCKSGAGFEHADRVNCAAAFDTAGRRLALQHPQANSRRRLAPDIARDAASSISTLRVPERARSSCGRPPRRQPRVSAHRALASVRRVAHHKAANATSNRVRGRIAELQCAPGARSRKSVPTRAAPKFLIAQARWSASARLVVDARRSQSRPAPAATDRWPRRASPPRR